MEQEKRPGSRTHKSTWDKAKGWVSNNRVVSGAVAGLAAGSVVPGVGNVVGAVVGAGVGYASAKEAEKRQNTER